MHEVAVASARALAFFVLSAARLTEISHWRVLGSEWTAGVVPMRQAFQRLLRILLVLKLDIHIAYHVVVQIIAHMELFNRTIGLRKLLVHFFIELVKLLLNELLRLGGISGNSRSFGVVVHVRNENSLAKCRSVVLSSAPVSMPTRANLKIERTVHSIFFCSIHPDKVICHTWM